MATTATSSVTATATALVDNATTQPASFKAIGAGLAIASGFMIGSSFVLKKCAPLCSPRRARCPRPSKERAELTILLG